MILFVSPQFLQEEINTFAADSDIEKVVVYLSISNSLTHISLHTLIPINYCFFFFYFLYPDLMGHFVIAIIPSLVMKALEAIKTGNKRNWGEERNTPFLDPLRKGMSLSKLQELVMDREAWHAAIHGVAKSQTRLSDWTELNWTEEKQNKSMKIWLGEFVVDTFRIMTKNAYDNRFTNWTPA